MAIERGADTKYLYFNNGYDDALRSTARSALPRFLVPASDICTVRTAIGCCANPFVAGISFWHIQPTYLGKVLSIHTVNTYIITLMTVYLQSNLSSSPTVHIYLRRRA